MAIFYAPIYGHPIVIPQKQAPVYDGGDYEEALVGILERTATSPALPTSLRTLGSNVFQNYSALTTLEIPFGVTKIADGACHSCANLASVSLPDSLTTIEAMAFYGCAALTTLTLPRSIESIAMWAFNGCTGLSTVTFTGTPVSLTGNVFSGCSNLTTINVPWAEGEVANAPWGATNATINYNYTASE